MTRRHATLPHELARAKDLTMPGPARREGIAASSGRALWVGTSWKMTKSIPQSLTYIRELAMVSMPPELHVFVLPAHTALAAVRNALAPHSSIMIGAQNAHWEPEGAATGEVSMRMIADAGAELVELGHSERRESFGETDERVALKVRAAVDQGLTPLICVGETSEVRDAEEASEVVRHQLATALSGLNPHESSNAIVAYEPVWAIGEQGRPARIDQILPVMSAIRQLGADTTSTGTLRALLYGGSVTVDNIGEFVTADGVDGVFVGRAAWDPAGMLQLMQRACDVHGLEPPTPHVGDARHDG